MRAKVGLRATLPPNGELDKAAVVKRICSDNKSRFSSPEGRANLRVIDLTFEERWIYLLELIQNAVDAGASRISMDAGEDWLTLQHDGPAPLTEESVRGLAGLFQSTKGGGTVGFMGIGFKSVFQRFRSVGVSGFGWSFRFIVEVETGAEFGDRQPDLLGAVLPVWDESVAPPDPGFTTRFEFRHLLDARAPLREDIEQALPTSDRTVLPLLAYKGVRELKAGDSRWVLEVQDKAGNPLVLARHGDVEERWRLFPVEYNPSKPAIARLLERRRLKPSPGDQERIYAEASRPRRVVGVMPVTRDDVPLPPHAGKAYALLPTASALPFGIHVDADWLVNISRRGLPELVDNEWQNEIIDVIADVLVSYLAWLTTRHNKDAEALQKGFDVLHVPDQHAEGALIRRIATPEWRKRMRAKVSGLEVLPAVDDGGIRLFRAADIRLVPQPLESLCDDPRLYPNILFGGPVAAPSVLTPKGIQFVRWLDLVQQLDVDDFKVRWPESLQQWWRAVEDAALRRTALFSLWSALDRLDTENDPWNLLATVPTLSGTWSSPHEIVFLNEPLPAKDEPRGIEVAAFLQPFIPSDNVRPAFGLVEAMRSPALGADLANRRAARDWFEALASLASLAEVVAEATSTEVEQDDPRTQPIVELAQWAMHRTRADLLTHLVVMIPEGRRVVPVGEALLADPYVEHGESRRRIWPSAGTVVADMVESDPGARDAREWRIFLERLPVLGPVRLLPREFPLHRYQRNEVSNFLAIALDDVWESNNSGYVLVDFEFDPALQHADVDAISGWLEEGYTALKGKSRRRVKYHYGKPEDRPGRHPAAWVDLLRTLAWVPCEDGMYRRPGDVLPTFDSAREDAPVARLSDGLVSTLREAGVEFGLRIAQAPILRQLQKKGSSLSPDELAVAIRDALAHIESVPTDRIQLQIVLQEIAYPNPRGGKVPFQRIVLAEGGGARSGFGGWLAAVSALPESLRSVLLDPRIPLIIPTRTTGYQALGFLQSVWARAQAEERGLAQEVSDYLPLAYSYVLHDLDADSGLEEQWDAARAQAYVFTNRRRWVAISQNPPAFADVDESLIRRFLTEDYELATGGQLGLTHEDQAMVADAIGIPRLSDVVSITRTFGQYRPRPEWEQRFSDLVTIVLAARGLEKSVVTPVRLRPVDNVTMQINGEPKAIDAFLEGSLLYVCGDPRRFAMDAINYLVDEYGLSQQARMAALLTSLVASLDDEVFFAETLHRLASEFAPEFEASSLSSIQSVARPTPPGIRTPPPPKTDSENAELRQQDALQKAAEQLMGRAAGGLYGGGAQGPANRGGTSGPSHGIRPPSAEQQARGKRGELEMLARLQGEGGYLGLRLVRDCRNDGCGYDFLCRSVEDGSEQEVELKTFIPSGTIHLTLGELERARASGARYTLIGLIDDNGHSSGWDARRLDDPYSQLIQLARAQLDVNFLMPAASVFLAD